MEIKRLTDISWSCSDDRYSIRLERDPWIRPEGPNPPVYVVQVGKYGPFTHYPLATLSTLDAAFDYIKQDAALPVFNDDGDCRWCGTSRSYLQASPAWWFGCNLCETEMDNTDETRHEREMEQSIAQHDTEFEPLHD